jgi:elongator complex protein 5
MGPGGPGAGDNDELVVEVVVRGGHGGGSGRRKGVERTLEGWRADAPLDITQLKSLRVLWSKQPAEEASDLVLKVEQTRTRSFS